MAIASVHNLRNIQEEFSKHYIAKLGLRGAENLELYNNNSKTRVRYAMSFDLLKILGHEIAMSNWSKRNKQVIWTAAVIAFFGSCRIDELLANTVAKKVSTLLQL